MEEEDDVYIMYQKRKMNQLFSNIYTPNYVRKIVLTLIKKHVINYVLLL